MTNKTETTMREILFRGKLSHSGLWVCGNLIIASNGQPYIYPKDVFEQDGHHLRIDSDNPFWVNPESVGQFTGLRDKNGVRIFEGDIVSAWSEGYNHVGEIRWRLDAQPAIIIYPAFANQGFWKLHGQSGIDNGCEVIGNIHENPELLSK